ncbi:unnamed protein product [Toxocara canis]|uniref:Ribosomal protein L23 n=1 Tax=Toxocara canis TaxID=6265 RepID=A0A183UDQ1_TOXCA|nr:unnamed protein product [Toxocara canis]
MRLSELVCLRRIIDSPYHPFQVIPKPDRWPSRERLRRFIAWQYGSERTTVRGGYRKQNKLFHYMTMQREDAPKLEKFVSLVLVQVFIVEKQYRFTTSVDFTFLVIVLLFQSLVMLTKQMAQEEGRAVITDPEQRYIETEFSLFGTPFPRARIFPRGPAENHKIKPRKLKRSEY